VFWKFAKDLGKRASPFKGECTMRIIKKESPSIRRKRHPARFADGEISHLEMVLMLVTQHNDYQSISGLGPKYWRRRVESIERTFDLVPTQKWRIDALLRLLKNQRSDDTVASEGQG
jgi:hypothetical protein